MRDPIQTVETRFYNKYLNRTDNPQEAFEEQADAIVSRFIATFRYALGKKFLVIRYSDVVVHFFNPSSLLNHIDYAAKTMPRNEPKHVPLFREINEDEQELMVMIMQLTVLGGGTAGIENGVVQTDWSSASFKNELGILKPDEQVQQFLRKSLLEQLALILHSGKNRHA
jgi:hypothetical protein